MPPFAELQRYLGRAAEGIKWPERNMAFEAGAPLDNSPPESSG